jgi:excisionase family DNA binding protein
MQMFTAFVEVDDRTPITQADGDLVDELVAALEPWHGTPTTSPRGFRAAQISLPAESIAQAAATAAAVVSGVYDGRPVIVLEVLTEKEFMNREGWGEPPSDLVSVSEAAEILGVTRQAVLQRISSKSLPAEKVGRDYVIPRKAVEVSTRRD